MSTQTDLNIANSYGSLTAIADENAYYLELDDPIMTPDRTPISKELYELLIKELA